VARIGNNENFQVEKFESMGAIGATGDPQNAYHCGNTIGTYLKKYGFDIDFAPVADVNTNPENIVIGARAFSDDPEVAAPMVVNYLQGRGGWQAHRTAHRPECAPRIETEKANTTIK